MTTPAGRSFTGTEARLLLRRARTAALGTNNRDPQGPYVSLANLATDAIGRPVIFISRLAWHTRNIEASPEASLMASEIPAEGDALTGPRVTVMGRFERLDAGHIAERYVQQHPAARAYIDFPDFAFWRLLPAKIHAVAGFGRIETMEPAEVLLSESAGAAITGDQATLADINIRHAKAVQALAARLGGNATGRWRVAAVDPDGLHLQSAEKTLRLNLPTPAATLSDLHGKIDALASRRD